MSELGSVTRKMVMASVAAMSLGAAESLRVVTYNIHGGRNIRNEFKPEPILEVLKRSKADIGGLNEVDRYCARSEFSDIVSDIRKNMNLYVAYGAAIPFDYNGAKMAAGDYGVAAFARKPFQVVEHFALPVPEGSEGRTALIVKTCEEKPIYFVTTHLPWEEGAEWDQVLIGCLRKIEARLKEGNYYPAILTGDMNRTQNSAVIEYMRKNWQVCNDANPQPTWPADEPNIQIDYIAFQPKNAFKVLTCGTMEEKVASDHRPLMADLERLD